ncbi:DUF975 family protein [Vagococcus jeotgali]|uniref:DUF975 family protein n=1 Tax=Vagococcus jeotgali TaxID=3109030 RepID=UPI002DDC771F|nr:DUF975 family protein [Vagococcus sp. B2T-5]
MYKSSKQLKAEAKDALRGRWKDAVILNIVPTILKVITIFVASIAIMGAVFIISNLSSFSSSDVESISASMSAQNSSVSSSLWTPIWNFFVTFLTIGISFTFLDVLRKGKEQSMSFKEAFRLFNGRDFGPIFLINLLSYIFQYLWTLLFIIPGIVKYYAYSQANFIYKDLSESEDTSSMGATNFITESRELMNGHKKRLFWLDISFLGWYIVGILTLGIGLLWIDPYINTTKAAFYKDLAKDKYLAD